MYRGETTQAPQALATDTDDELRAGIAAAQALGMRASLSPMFDPDYSELPWWNTSSGGRSESQSLAGGGAGRGKWGAGWSASQIENWFAEYSLIIVAYAKLAEETGCDSFHVGHELHELLTNAENEAHWRGLIGKVRKRGAAQLLRGGCSVRTEQLIVRELRFCLRCGRCTRARSQSPSTGTPSS